jgi:LemA protein
VACFAAIRGVVDRGLRGTGVLNALYGALGVIALTALYVIVTYNRLVWHRNLVQEGWSGIDVQLRRRADLVPNLVETVRGYAAHEKGLFEQLAA